MSYFKPSRPLYHAQTDNILQYAGQTATWHQYVSATTGVPAAGIGGQSYYVDSVITAVFGGGGVGGGVVGANLTRQLALGQLEAGQVRISTHQPLSKEDEVIWNGIRYRVDTDSQFSPLNGFYMSILTRGDN